MIAISGPVCAGKTTLAAGIARVREARILTTRLLIADHLGRAPDELTRGELQRAGEELDEERGGDWVAEQVWDLSRGSSAPVVVDAVRNSDQLLALREHAGIFHVHLAAEPGVLAARYAERSRASPQLEFLGFEELRASPTEARVEGLGELAEMAIDTSHLCVDETLARVLRRLDQGSAEEAFERLDRE